MIAGFQDAQPSLSKGVWIAPSATVIGDVTLEQDVNVWYGTVMRGDVGAIRVGARTNIQDLSMLHMNGGEETVVGQMLRLGTVSRCMAAPSVIVYSLGWGPLS